MEELAFTLTPQKCRDPGHLDVASRPWWSGGSCSMSRTGGEAPILGVPVVVLAHESPTDWRYPGARELLFVTEGMGPPSALSRSPVRRTLASPRAQSRGNASRQAYSMRWPSTWCRWSWGRDGLTASSLTVIRTCWATDDNHSRGERVTHLVFPVGKG